MSLLLYTIGVLCKKTQLFTVSFNFTRFNKGESTLKFQKSRNKVESEIFCKK